jgi:hypothetical protein
MRKLQAVRQCSFDPTFFGWAYSTILTETTFTFRTLLGENMARAGFIVSILAGTGFFEPLGGTFSGFHLGHRYSP